MTQSITGLHHVTAITRSAQDNLDFYAGFLGLRLVKKTVNFDGPQVYHFYYGNESGDPGTILTFFPYTGLVSGRQGKGMLNTTAFSVSSGSLDYWLSRLDRFKISHKKPQERFAGEVVIYLEDPDGLGLELVFTDRDSRAGYTPGTIPLEHSIRGIFNVEIWEEGYERTAGLLTERLEHKLIAEKGNRFRFAATDSPGNYVDILCSPDSLRGLAGSGTVHHLAFSTPGKQEQAAVREKLINSGLNASPVLDRFYFSSIYFREPGGVLFEVATAGPGFAIDEDDRHLGESLKLPSHFEPDREQIESVLPPVTINIQKFS
jgi:glyoxalase family protein